jgi:hypothetical protein
MSVGVYMKCFACNELVEELPTYGSDHVCIVCPFCGKYKVTGTAKTMIENRNIDPAVIADILDNKRRTSDDIPTIDSMDL